MVGDRIKDILDREIAGELTFTDPAPEWVEAVRQRIEKKRASERESYGN